ncbi:MAG: glycosyltransferase family 39 protein [Candidatus Goldbacteria bacterium]|nr:glycosyltransferase family 39 protein [Candidatus Goldiibacteriota bacterium]
MPDKFSDNKKTLHAVRTEIIVFVLLILTASVLLFTGLGTRALWQDEAQTPLIAKTVIDRGLPYGTDGLNYFSQDGGIEYGPDYIWKWHPWFQFYYLAAFIKVFGESNFMYRFPFALLGLFSVIVVYFYIRNLTKSFKRALFASAFLLFSVFFLLLVRQSRYYSPEILFTLISLFSYALYVREGKKMHLVVWTAVMTMLFHTIYLYFYSAMLAFFIHYVIFVRRRDISLFAFFAGVFAVNTPFVFLLYNIEFNAANSNMFSLIHFGQSALAYLKFIFQYVFSPLLIAAALLFVLEKVSRKQQVKVQDGIEWLLVIFAVTGFICISVLTDAPFLRNTAGIAAALSVLAGLLVYKIYERHKLAGLLLSAVLLLNMTFFKYIKELRLDWKEAGECITEFLNANSAPGDAVFITYPDLVVKLYTGLRVYGGLTGEDFENVKNPKFVVIRKYIGSEYEKRTLAYLRSNVDESKYKKYILPCADRFWENREDPVNHDFEPDEKEEKVIIYKRIRP